MNKSESKKSCARFFPAPITGVFLTVILISNTLAFGVPVIIGCLIRLLAQAVRFQQLDNLGLAVVAWASRTWMLVNLWFVRCFVAIDWDVKVEAELRFDRSYLITSNHQSWVDIMSLYASLIHEISFLRFFIKDRLKYVPILGLAWWGLDYPFMKRYSKEFLEKHPELKGQDLETTRKSCDRFRGKPVAIINFLEGTRFKSAIHAKQQSPYQHLLKPKAGGLAFAVGAMGNQLHSLLSITVVYPQGVGELWDFLCGRVQSITVRVHEHEIPSQFFTGDYQTDPQYRTEFQTWVADLWSEKDAEISDLL